MNRGHSFSPRFNQFKRSSIQLLSEILQPYRNTHGLRHRLVTDLFFNLLAETEYANPALVKELQLIRLKKILHTANRVPFWRERFIAAGLPGGRIRSLEDIRKLPPVTRHSFTDIPRNQLTARQLSKDRWAPRFTSGTTGIPFEWWSDKNTLFVEAATFFHRAISWQRSLIKNPGGEPFIASFVYISHPHPTVDFFWNPTADDADATVRRILHTMREKNLRILYSYPSNLLLFAKAVAETGQDMPFELVVGAGQEMTDENRVYMEQWFKCPVISMYGSREFEQVANECPLRKRHYHINSERVLVEILDVNGCNLPDGEFGIVTITSFENRAMPLVRYQLQGDLGRIVPGNCPCGRTLPLMEVQGRGADYIKLPSGKPLLFQFLNKILIHDYFKEIVFYQVTQTLPDIIIIRLSLRANCNRSEFEEKIRAHVGRLSGGELKVTFEYPPDWNIKPSQKVRLFTPLPEV